MNIFRKNMYFVFSFICFLFLTMPLKAQIKVQSLIISEVYFDKTQPLNNWIEIYNPTDKPLVLERLRPSHIRTKNVLPSLIRGPQGITILPDEYLVLCADSTQFKSKWKNIIDLIVVQPLSHLEKGGFISISTKNIGESGWDGIRYGEPSLSNSVKDFYNCNVIDFSRNGKSFSRNIAKLEDSLFISDFIESVPSPGISSKTN